MSAPEPMTDRQEYFLMQLIRERPHDAIRLGASEDGKTLRRGITKDEASGYIDMLKSSV